MCACVRFKDVTMGLCVPFTWSGIRTWLTSLHNPRKDFLFSKSFCCSQSVGMREFCFPHQSIHSFLFACLYHPFKTGKKNAANSARTRSGTARDTIPATNSTIRKTGIPITNRMPFVIPQAALHARWTIFAVNTMMPIKIVWSYEILSFYYSLPNVR